jgi:hypothetical protein
MSQGAEKTCVFIGTTTQLERINFYGYGKRILKWMFNVRA